MRVSPINNNYSQNRKTSSNPSFGIKINKQLTQELLKFDKLPEKITVPVGTALVTMGVTSINKLLETKTDENGNAIFQYTRAGLENPNEEITSQFQKRFKDELNYLSPYKSVDENSRIHKLLTELTPYPKLLHKTVNASLYELAKKPMLIKYMYDVLDFETIEKIFTEPDNKNNTLLHYACAYDNTKTINIMHDIVVNKEDKPELWDSLNHKYDSEKRFPIESLKDENMTVLLKTIDDPRFIFTEKRGPLNQHFAKEYSMPDKEFLDIMHECLKNELDTLVLTYTYNEEGDSSYLDGYTEEDEDIKEAMKAKILELALDNEEIDLDTSIKLLKDNELAPAIVEYLELQKESQDTKRN